MWKRTIGTALLLLTMTTAANSQQKAKRVTSTEPTNGPYAYHQLRTLSGLGGAGYGLDSEGRYSLAGPVAFSNPTAYTLGHGRWWLGGGQHSFTRRPIFSDTDGNWNYFLMYGQTVGRVNIALTVSMVGSDTPPVYNFQIQPISPANSSWTFSAGIANFSDAVPTVDYDGNPISTRSLFAVTTYRPTLKSAFYLSMGIGTQRFGKGFASASYQFAPNWRGWIEGDQFSFYSGLVYATKFGHGERGAPFTVQFGSARLRYFLFGLGVGF